MDASACMACLPDQQYLPQPCANSSKLPRKSGYSYSSPFNDFSANFFVLHTVGWAVDKLIPGWCAPRPGCRSKPPNHVQPEYNHDQLTLVLCQPTSTEDPGECYVNNVAAAQSI